MKFGDYVLIEQFNYGCDNDMFLHKVIGTLKSNSYVDVPVKLPRTEQLHKECVDVVRCICCGVDERDVFTYRQIDVKPNDKFNTSSDTFNISNRV